VSPQSTVYAVPTHLEQRGPFAFGRSVGEIAKLVVVGFATANVLGAEQLQPALRITAAAVVLVAGILWALVRIQRRPLDGWLTLAFRYGAAPRHRVWRSGSYRQAPDLADPDAERSGYELNHVRVRWIEQRYTDRQLQAEAPNDSQGTL